MQASSASSRWWVVRLHDKKRPAPYAAGVAVSDPRVSPENELVLAMVGTAARRRAMEPRALELLGQVGFERLTSVLARQSLLPLVGTRLAELAPEALPAAFRGRVERSVRMVSRVATLQAGVALRLVSNLDRAGIPAVPLKGALLAEDVFDHAGLREAHDIDLLVDRHDLGPAVEALQREGWEVRGPEPPCALPPLHHALVHPSSGWPRLELHWRIHWYETEFSSSLVAGSRSVPGRGRRATPPEELVALLLFYARDGFVGLRYPADIAAWWDANGGALELNALDPILRAHPELADAIVTSLRVAESTTGVPAGRVTSLPPARTVRSGLAERLADWSIHQSLDQVTANVTLVDWLLSPPGAQRAFLRRTLFLPRPAIRRLYRLADDDRLRAFLLQAAHPPKVLLRYVAAIWAIRGERRWTPVPVWHHDGPKSAPGDRAPQPRPRCVSS